MKYFVRFGDRELMVEIDGESVQVDGRAVLAHLERVAGTPVVALQLDGKRHELAVIGREGGTWHLVDRGTVREVEALDERTRHIRALAGTAATEASGGVVKAPMPGLVVRVLVTEGEPVTAGQGLVVLEAMKMENELKAPSSGVVLAVRAVPGLPVEKGSVLVELGPAS